MILPNPKPNRTQKTGDSFHKGLGDCLHGVCDCCCFFRLDVADTEGKKALKALSCGVPRKVQVIPSPETKLSP